MHKIILPVLIAMLAVPLASCQRHPEMRYQPEQYAKLRNIEILTTPPERAYQVVATVTGKGGKFTARETMMNAMIDEARKSGAEALIPLDFAGGKGLDLFMRVEDGKVVTKGQAIKWEVDPRWQQQ